MSALSTLRFATFRVPNQVFYQSALSAGIVNLKPLVPGHVLVIPRRVAPRFRDLTADEVTDLFQSVHQISRVIEQEYKAQALNIALQDGPLAGQSVPHVHIHIIPRHAKDFEPIDEMYTELDSKNLAQDFADAYAARPSRAERKAFEAEQRAKEEGKADAPFAGIEDERRPRSVDEMREEALRLSGLFPPENRCDFE
ncbi:HIT-like domain-containing protein [Rhodotorula diobovata]|uniref:HIT-like domain-containing protein n=1 Tax=Rhodotorula diobovata TaxID=5288 RepID=A0A5C5G4R8_9BASI|nr:HIT-like domain-containing protein [Rhodotorula diobovata]